MGSSPESDFSNSANRSEANNSSVWSLDDLFSKTALTPALDRSNSLDNIGRGTDPARSNEQSILPNFSLQDGGIGADRNGTNSTRSSGEKLKDAPTDSGDGGLAQSFGDKLSGIMTKIGQFLQSVLPPEYAQYVQQYLPMAEQFIGNLLKDVKTGDGANGSKHMEAELNEPQTVPDVLPDTTLQVDQKLGFDMNWGANGPELSNIQGLHLQGQTNGEVKSGRLELNDGSPTLYATVQGADGQSNEVPIPLPDVSELLSQFEQQ